MNHKTVYETIWRNKWLTADCHSLSEMADRLEYAAKELREMNQAGIQLSNSDDISDDYAFLTTTDSIIAEKYEFQELEYDQDEDWVCPACEEADLISSGAEQVDIDTL